jgi:hypothetical protein
MNILIENYRGWEIFFNTDQEVFYSHCDKYDRDETKKTFSASKKFIDDYIKANFEFKPVRITNEDGKLATLTGIRKDKAFMAVDSGEETPYQISKYSEKNWFLEKEENEPIFKRTKEIYEETVRLDKERTALKKQLVKVNLVEYRKQITGEE